MKSALMKLFNVVLFVLFVLAANTFAQEVRQVESIQIDAGDLSVMFCDNSKSPDELSGIDRLVNVKQSAEYDAFDPTTEGASAGLNFEHIISGHDSPNNKFTPRHGPYTLIALPGGQSVVLRRLASDSPWRVASSLKYTVVAPHYIDFEFRCTPEDASLFGERGSAIFFFANYMNDVLDTALQFRGCRSSDSSEEWISADAPSGHPDWNRGGNYRALTADEIPYDEDMSFRLNSWTYDWPRITQPFYYGRADHGMTFILMFDRLVTAADQIRFSLYKFKLPKHPRPAWDFQYVVNRMQSGKECGFQGRLVWKKFVSLADCLREYETWSSDSASD